MNIIDAINDPQLFRPFLQDDQDQLTTWEPWFSALRAVYGLKTKKAEHALIRQCTGRDPSKLPREGFSTALFLTGRRSGKSRTAAIIAAYEAALSGRHERLAKGEQGVIPVISPTRRQSAVVRQYIRAIFNTPLLTGEILKDDREGFTLRNGVSIECLVADWRTVRSFTLLAAVVDEACFLGYSEESKVKSDTELIRALRPGLATCQGRLIAISSPYAEKGWCYQRWKRDFGNDRGKCLVWNCPSRVMNETLPQSVIDEAYDDDPASARSEYGGLFRDDVSTFVPRELVESLVVKGRRELPPNAMYSYVAFADMSGGRSDDAALCIAHRQDGKVVIDLLHRFRPPHDPHRVVAEMCRTIRRYNLDRVLGDAYSAEWSRTAFQSLGIKYERASQSVWNEGSSAKRKIGKPRSQLYSELLPILHAGEIELPDDELLITQLSGLERKTRSGGKDIVDHGPGAHDDLANVVAGAANYASQRKVVVGALKDPWKDASPLEKWNEHCRRQEEWLNESTRNGTDPQEWREANEAATRAMYETDPYFQQFRS